MNFDDLKSSYQSLSFSGGERENIDFTRKLQDAFEQVRKEDIRDKQRIIGVSILLGGFVLAYGTIGLLKYLESMNGAGYWGYAIYVLALISWVPLLIKEYRQNKSIDYTVSLMQFIENVEKRFALFQIKDLLIIPGLLMIDLSVVFMISEFGIPTIKTIIFAQIILIFSLTIGLIVRLIVWRRKLFLLDELRRIKQLLK